MPENPYGDISLEEIIRTGTLDGVKEPETLEELEVFNNMIRYYDYTEAMAALHATVDSWQNDMTVDSMGEHLREVSERAKNDYLLDRLVEQGISAEDLEDETKYTPEQREALIASIMEDYIPDEKLRQVEAVKEMFDLDKIEAMLEEKVSQIGKLIDDQFDRILSGFDKAVEKIQSLPEDTDME